MGQIDEFAASSLVVRQAAKAKPVQGEAMDRSIQELTWEHDAIIDSSSDGLFVCDGTGRQ